MNRFNDGPTLGKLADGKPQRLTVGLPEPFVIECGMPIVKAGHQTHRCQVEIQTGFYGGDLCKVHMERFIEVAAAMVMCKAKSHCGMNLCRHECPHKVRNIYFHERPFYQQRIPDRMMPWYILPWHIYQE
ncbi:hypothetical protein [Phyllobacterium zundukense]|uniref:Uncharacterized protein n=1 Tax=Phyllobacterium zundukense TaxID=1867719 RepID=A0ACD4CVI3_9HYPH|nr:hypothetical protein [Phyllobacterium zundukense]UXN57568.1 hypothetical protein N8E88_04395 [Phyllobacterium zundukense]